MEEQPSEFIRGPKWRTRTTPGSRHRAAAVTFAVIVALGTATLVAAMWLLTWIGAPSWVVAAPWWLPTAGVLVWTLARPAVSGLSDDDDDSWFGYSIRWALVGELAARPAPARIVAAVLTGAPVVWAIVVFGLLTLTGIV